MDTASLHRLAEACEAQPAFRGQTVPQIETYLADLYAPAPRRPKPQPAAKSFARFFKMSEAVADLAAKGRG